MMRRFSRRQFSRLRRLLADQSGVSLIESAIALPLLAFLCLVGVELANLTVAYLRVNSIAIKSADNVARVRSSIDEADVKEVFLGAKRMGDTIDFAEHGRVIVSSIEPVMDSGSPPTVKNQYLRWQRCTGAHPADSSHGLAGDGASGTGQTDGYGLPGKPKIKAAANTAIILAEVVYDYQPMISNWFGPVTIRTSQAITVRERSDQAIKNGSGLPNSQKALCSNPHTA